MQALSPVIDVRHLEGAYAFSLAGIYLRQRVVAAV